MKIVFLLDNNAYLEATPEQLQLRPIAPGQSALGVNVTVPVRNEDGTPKLGEDGKPQTVVSFASLINYAVDLVTPAPAPAPTPAPESPAAPAAPEPPEIDWKTRAEFAEARVAQLEAPAETPTKVKRLRKKGGQ